jgi:hypothetical protein
MHTQTNQGNCPETPLSFDRVIGALNDALRLFGEGKEDQGCLRLAEANCLFDSCLAAEDSEAGVTPISVANTPRRSGEAQEANEADEEAILATIA